MRVTFVLPHAGLSGGTRVVALHAAGLRDRGHEVCVISRATPAPSLRTRLAAARRGRWLPLRRTPEPSHLDGLGLDWRVVDRATGPREEEVPDADVIVATWWETGEWVARMPASKGAKVHFIQHHEVDAVWPGIPDERATAVWRMPFHRMAVSEWLRTIGRERYGVDQMDLVPNAVDTELFCVPERGRRTAPTIGFLWTPVPSKGCDVAVEAARLARRGAPELRCLVFGSGERPGEALLPPWMSYEQSPPQEAIVRLYASCDAWLFPSRMEGFGLPILEAMACRTPVIGTPAGAAPELIGEGGGILVPADDAAAMAEAITRVVRMDEGAWRRMSEAARRTAEGHTWSAATDLFEASLRRAARAAERGAGVPERAEAAVTA